jgi:hypothetical protein
MAGAATITIVEVMVMVRAFVVQAEHALVIKIIVTILALHLRLPQMGRLATSQGQAQSRRARAANKPGYARRDHGRHTSSVRAAVLGPAPLVVR